MRVAPMVYIGPARTPCCSTVCTHVAPMVADQRTHTCYAMLMCLEYSPRNDMVAPRECLHSAEGCRGARHRAAMDMFRHHIHKQCLLRRIELLLASQLNNSDASSSTFETFEQLEAGAALRYFYFTNEDLELRRHMLHCVKSIMHAVDGVHAVSSMLQAGLIVDLAGPQPTALCPTEAIPFAGVSVCVARAVVVSAIARSLQGAPSVDLQSCLAAASCFSKQHGGEGIDGERVAHEHQDVLQSIVMVPHSGRWLAMFTDRFSAATKGTFRWLGTDTLAVAYHLLEEMIWRRPVAPEFTSKDFAIGAFAIALVATYILPAEWLRPRSMDAQTWHNYFSIGFARAPGLKPNMGVSIQQRELLEAFSFAVRAALCTVANRIVMTARILDG